MKALVERVLAGLSGAKAADHDPANVTVEVVDISNDADLEARYGLEIPVLMIDGRKAAKYRISEDDLTRRLTRRP